MRVSIPKEILPGERRVAASPDSVKKLVAMGFEVAVERGAGDRAATPDRLFEAAGAAVVDDPWAGADVVLKVRPPSVREDGRDEAELVPEGATLVSFLWPARNGELVARLAARNVTALAIDQVPRISRAQKMDALSSMANIAGYRAVIEAAHHFGSFFCGQMTAAGKVAPAKVLVIGAGVAGLAALGAAKGLGAVVRAFDTRAAVRDQVKSMGGEFLEVTVAEEGEGGGGYAKEMSPAFVEAEMALFRKQAAEVDVVITTALIPGKPAPKLWLRDMVEAMRPGSVVVDLAAESGGNCELTVPDQVVEHRGVKILGRTDLTSCLATTASQLYANNLVHLLTDMGGAKLAVNLDDEVVRNALVAHKGEVTWPPPREVPKPKAPSTTPVVKPAAPAVPKTHGPPPPSESGRTTWLAWVSIALLLVGYVAVRATGTGAAGEDDLALRLFAERVTVFVLSCFVGWQVVWNVTPALHTPLMSVTNAISGIIVLGGMLHTRVDAMGAAAWLGVGAVLLATVNVAGGFLVTRRMLEMFRK
ncbi:MAG: Re/Si-specific NAD(P)(+) transhydrogenase subunit alpha [Polyangiales bacterium]